MRFLAFSYDHYYPLGGLNDIKAVGDTFEAARSALESQEWREDNAYIVEVLPASSPFEERPGRFRFGRVWLRQKDDDGVDEWVSYASVADMVAQRDVLTVECPVMDRDWIKALS